MGRFFSWLGRGAKWVGVLIVGIIVYALYESVRAEAEILWEDNRRKKREKELQRLRSREAELEAEEEQVLRALEGEQARAEEIRRKREARREQREATRRQLEELKRARKLDKATRDLGF